MLVHRRPFNGEIRDQGLDWPLFGYTMIGRRRLDNIQFCVEDIFAHITCRELIETGVWPQASGQTPCPVRLLWRRGGGSATTHAACLCECLNTPNARRIPGLRGQQKILPY